MIDVFNLYNGSLYSKKEFSMEIPVSEFPKIDLSGEVKVRGAFFRIEEGIQVHFDFIKFSQKGLCSSCGKAIAQSKEIRDADWTYYEKEPTENEDMFEHLMIDTKNMKLDLSEALRQDILLNFNFDLRCKTPCRKEKPEKEKKDPGVKALAGLKDMWKK